MKCNPLRWLWALLPLAVFSWLAAMDIRPAVERDLTKRVTEALRAENLDWAKVRFEGRDGTLSGRANEDGEPGQALQLGSAIRGVRVLEGQADLLRKVDPYVWSAVSSGSKVVLEGFVPSEKVHKAVVAAAKGQFGKTEIEDSLDFARGNPAPGEFTDAIKFGLKQLALLKSGKLELSGTSLSLSGQAASAEAYKAVKTALSSGLPKGFKLGADKVTAPAVHPYTAQISTAGSAIDVRGYVPSEAARASIIGALKQKFPSANVHDGLALASGEPAAYETCLLAAIKGMGHLTNGQVSLTDKVVELSGVTEDEALAQSVPAEFKAGAKGCEPKVAVTYDDSKKRKAAEAAAEKAAAEKAAADKADAEKTAHDKAAADKAAADKAAADKAAADKAAADKAAAEKAAADKAAADKAKLDADEKARKEAEAIAAEKARKAAEVAKQSPAANACEGELRNAHNAGTIQFERASDVLLKPSLPTLRALANIASKCENVLIEIEGHTDSEGIPERNQPLSERRAQSVVNFLVEAGVSADRIKAIGYGDTRPVAPNDTAENRAKNRRIEFSVKSK